MTSGNSDDTWYRGKVLISLRHGIRQSSRLAEELTGDLIVGNEALGLLGRLKAIGAELDSLAFSNPDIRRAHNDPLWDLPPHPFRTGAASQSGM
ncbi:hypothetical protein GGQ97_002743 [Sphingomonas kaistensis]|uniref:Uncharacterized protein n=1 Tax=Sphingomonas kaistensis TaxID=298708 RepID=A0A7X6BHW5_9SPHN|nr:hypothetical protein [Sphingomonas kaistensis]NJC06950.1 hypothetical protein [Sphingomonas kaistensis]